MTYRINNGAKLQFTDGFKDVLMYGGDVVVAIDPSKTNMGVAIGDTDRNIFAYLELSGKGCDTTEYCIDLKKFFTKYLSKVHILSVGIEQAVQYKGYQYYHSQMVLTQIRATLLEFFLEHFHVKVNEINNYAWKGAILPDGYRGHSEKGSQRWLAEQGITGLSDDVTDAICIYLYVVSLRVEPAIQYCVVEEEPLVPYKLCIVPDTFELQEDYPLYVYNPQISLHGNISYYINRNFKPFKLLTPIEKLTTGVIYSSKCVFTHIPDSAFVVLLVMRC